MFIISQFTFRLVRNGLDQSDITEYKLRHQICFHFQAYRHLRHTKVSVIFINLCQIDWTSHHLWYRLLLLSIWQYAFSGGNDIPPLFLSWVLALPSPPLIEKMPLGSPLTFIVLIHQKNQISNLPRRFRKTATEILKKHRHN